MADQETAPISQRVLRTLLVVVLRKTPDEALSDYATTGSLFGIKVALAAGADINGSEALELASYWGKTEAVLLLLKNKADVNARCAFGFTPLYGAVSGRHDRITEILIEHGADVHARTDDRETPLHAACHGKNSHVTAFLIEKGAAIDAQNKWGETPLHIADACRNRDNVYVLLKAGASTLLRDSTGRTVLERSSFPDTLWLIGLMQREKFASVPQTPTDAFSSAQGAGPINPETKQAPISRRMALAIA